MNQSDFVLFDSVAGLIWVADCLGNRIFFNKAWLSYRGKPRDPPIDSEWQQAIHSPDFKHYLDTYQHSLKVQQGYKIAFRLLGLDGQYRLMTEEVIPRFNSQGVFQGMVGNCIDFSDYQNHPGHESSQFYQVIDSIPALIAHVGKDQRYLLYNQAYKDWFGLQDHQIKGKYIWEVIGQEAYNKVAPYVQEALAGKKVSFEMELPYAHRGSTCVHVSYVPQYQNGEANGFAVLVADISLKKRMEEALKESEQRFRLLFEQSPLGILTVSPNGDVLAFNHAWLELWGDHATAVNVSSSKSTCSVILNSCRVVLCLS